MCSEVEQVFNLKLYFSLLKWFAAVCQAFSSEHADKDVYQNTSFLLYLQLVSKKGHFSLNSKLRQNQIHTIVADNLKFKLFAY
jgi:hypothetical protein